MDASSRQAPLPLGLPDGFSVAARFQVVPRDVLAGIEAFLGVFERVTTRPAWQRGVTREAPELARAPRREVCFFSAWDFHLPPGRPCPWQLIECNDNGSGLLFAARIDRGVWEREGLAARGDLEPPARVDDFEARLVAMVEREAEGFFGGRPEGALAIVDDADSLAHGRFRAELERLRELLAGRGWAARLVATGDLRFEGGSLRAGAEPVAFVVNRSTDFFLEGEACAALAAAYAAGSVYVAPSPFTYATRSDKRLLEALSTPERDAELGITPEERAVLSAHVPETRLVTEANAEALAAAKNDWVFKPVHGYAGHGLLPAAQVGARRLRRLAAHGEGYVAQRVVPKPVLRVAGAHAEAPTELWTDLRVWAYRGERTLLGGRASRRPDRIDLAPPGGWIATFVAR